MALRVDVPVLLLALLTPAFVHAETGDAAAHYDAGAHALQRGDLRAAAREFAEADRLAPHPTTLTEALRAALDAGELDLVADLSTRAERRPSTAELERLLAQAKRVLPAPPAAAPLPVSRPIVQLEGPPECTLVDSAPVSGSRLITVRCPQASMTTLVPLQGARLHVDYKTRRGPPMLATIGVAGLSAAALTFGLLRGASAASLHDDLIEAGCPTRGSVDCTALADRGRSVQTQANVGFVAAGVLGAAAIGMFVWQRDASVSIAVSPQRVGLLVRWP